MANAELEFGKLGIFHMHFADFFNAAGAGWYH